MYIATPPLTLALRSCLYGGSNFSKSRSSLAICGESQVSVKQECHNFVLRLLAGPAWVICFVCFNVRYLCHEERPLINLRIRVSQTVVLGSIDCLLRASELKITLRGCYTFTILYMFG